MTVDVWRVALDGGTGGVVLSDDERARAARFRFERDRVRYAAAHTALRAILGAYLEVAPERLAFDHTSHGKPFVRGASSLSFNLSHSGDLALVAVAPGAAVGVDIEQVRDDVECERLARRFFSDHEQRELFALPAADRMAAFFTCWTRKEAFIKGVGEGLSIPLADFDVPVAVGSPARLLAFRTDETAAARWSLADVPVADGSAAAVAVETPALCVESFDWRAAAG